MNIIFIKFFYYYSVNKNKYFRFLVSYFCIFLRADPQVCIISSIDIHSGKSFLHKNIQLFFQFRFLCCFKCNENINLIAFIKFLNRIHYIFHIIFFYLLAGNG